MTTNLYSKHLRTVDLNGKKLLAKLHFQGHEEVTYFPRYTAAQLVAEDLDRKGVKASVSKRFAGYVVVIS